MQRPTHHLPAIENLILILSHVLSNEEDKNKQCNVNVNANAQSAVNNVVMLKHEYVILFRKNAKTGRAEVVQFLGQVQCNARRRA